LNTQTPNPGPAPVTSQQYFSLTTNQPSTINQQYFSKKNRHRPSVTGETNKKKDCNSPLGVPFKQIRRVTTRRPRVWAETVFLTGSKLFRPKQIRAESLFSPPPAHPVGVGGPFQLVFPPVLFLRAPRRPAADAEPAPTPSVPPRDHSRTPAATRPTRRAPLSRLRSRPRRPTPTTPERERPNLFPAWRRLAAAARRPQAAAALTFPAWYRPAPALHDGGRPQRQRSHPQSENHLTATGVYSTTST
jgi:hypothetical protein